MIFLDESDLDHHRFTVSQAVRFEIAMITFLLGIVGVIFGMLSLALMVASILVILASIGAIELDRRWPVRSTFTIQGNTLIMVARRPLWPVSRRTTLPLDRLSVERQEGATLFGAQTWTLVFAVDGWPMFIPNLMCTEAQIQRLVATVEAASARQVARQGDRAAEVPAALKAMGRQVDRV